MVTPAEVRPWFVPLDESQERAIAMIQRSHVTFLLGGAGSGKTHVALGTALTAFALGQTKRLLLTRPVIGVGPTLGFIPGTIEEKYGPWLEPLRDVHSQMSFTKFEDLPCEPITMEHIRGRSFTDGIGILDEAQNMRESELVAYLTRLGRNGKLIVCGDTDQTDIEGSALYDLAHRLKGLAGFSTVKLTGQHRNPFITLMLKRIKETKRVDS